VADVRTEVTEGVLTASLTGDIDIASAAELGTRILAAVPADSCGVVVDLSAVRYIDSSGMRMLFELSQRLQGAERPLRVASPRGTQVRRVLAIAALDQLVPVHESAAEAKAALDGG
jgi:anti-anti-sigma factor